MYVARFLVVALLILVIVVAYHPQAQESVGKTWENIQPALGLFMDNMYAALRNMIVGDDSQDQIDNNQPSPGVDFDLIVT